MAYCLQCGQISKQKIPEGDNRLRWVCDACGFIYYENPKVVCGALAIHEDKVLLCRRAIEPRYGYWTIPAGFMENGETMAEGSARETVEEADARIESPHLYCIYDLPAIGQIYVLYAAKLTAGSYGVGCESLECALFTEDEIPWDEIAFEAVKRTLKHYFNDRKSQSDYHMFALHQETIGKDKNIRRY